MRITPSQVRCKNETGPETLLSPAPAQGPRQSHIPDIELYRHKSRCASLFAGSDEGASWWPDMHLTKSGAVDES
jgi:hypothetical protein